MSHFAPRSATLVAGGLGSVIAGIVLPSIVISAFAAITRDPQRTTYFALTVAEPLALLGAAAVTSFTVARTARPGRGAWRWGALAGGVAAMSMVGAAWWVADVDRWTAIAAAVLPLVGIAAARWAPRRPDTAVRAGDAVVPGLLAAPPVVEAHRSREAAPEMRQR